MIGDISGYFVADNTKRAESTAILCVSRDFLLHTWRLLSFSPLEVASFYYRTPISFYSRVLVVVPCPSCGNAWCLLLSCGDHLLFSGEWGPSLPWERCPVTLLVGDWCPLTLLRAVSFYFLSSDIMFTRGSSLLLLPWERGVRLLLREWCLLHIWGRCLLLP